MSNITISGGGKNLTVADLKKALENLPDGAEVLIQTANGLYNVTGTEISFFNSPNNKHIKLTSELSNEITVNKDEQDADKKRLDAFEEAVRVLKEI